MNHDLFAQPPEPRPARGRRPVGRGGDGSLRRAPDEPYTVSAVNALAKNLIESSLPPLWVQGEVTNWKRHGSGHCYFSLRDRSAQLRAVMFRLDAQRLPADPDEGMQVRALGTLTLYEKRGEYQFVVRALEGTGAGGLWRVALDRLRAKLEAEGLLDADRKRPLPRFPATVGVVTSPVGAALQDVLHVIRARAPWTRVLLAPARVQGDGAGRDIAAAVRALGHSGLAHVIIVGRGGGSAEDLWAFNEEAVARAIAASPVPVISAVGHETDVTIADLVADVRAPTPSAAAERAVPDRHALSAQLDAVAGRMRTALARAATSKRVELGGLNHRLENRITHLVEARREHMQQLARRLHALSPLAALERGFAVPLTQDGRILRRAVEFEPGTRFRLRVTDGSVQCQTDSADAVAGDGIAQRPAPRDWDATGPGTRSTGADGADG